MSFYDCYLCILVVTFRKITVVVCWLKKDQYCVQVAGVAYHQTTPATILNSLIKFKNYVQECGLVTIIRVVGTNETKHVLWDSKEFAHAARHVRASC